MPKCIILVNIFIIIQKIFISGIVRWIDIDHVDFSLMRLLQKFQAVQIIPFKQEVSRLSPSSRKL